MNVLVTGANGFIGKNLVEALIQIEQVETVKHLRGDSVESLFEKLKTTDLVFHIAGVNRSQSDSDFVEGNVDSTLSITNYLIEKSRSIPIVFTSSVQSGSESIYGKTKASAENLILRYAELSGAPVKIYRLPNVFGKYSKPDYNSVVATFCYRTINNIPVVVHNESSLVTLVFIDDVVSSMASVSSKFVSNTVFERVQPEFEISVGKLLKMIQGLALPLNADEYEGADPRLFRSLKLTFESFQNPSL
jgi:UDP-2-acetamido-2,6-beta-L-arabino-hexul-4-ose reductase